VENLCLLKLFLSKFGEQKHSLSWCSETLVYHAYSDNLVMPSPEIGIKVEFIGRKRNRIMWGIHFRIKGSENQNLFSCGLWPFLISTTH
jgi:hypothetical protein